jgi:hypothetical protein
MEIIRNLIEIIWYLGKLLKILRKLFGIYKE